MSEPVWGGIVFVVVGFCFICYFLLAYRFWDPMVESLGRGERDVFTCAMLSIKTREGEAFSSVYLLI